MVETPTPATPPSDASSDSRERERYTGIISMLNQQCQSQQEELKQAQDTIQTLQEKLAQAEKDRDLAISEFKRTLDAAQTLKQEAAARNQTLQNLQNSNRQLRQTIQQLNTQIQTLYTQLNAMTTQVPDTTNLSENPSGR